MKISKLIQELENIMEIHGDYEVEIKEEFNGFVSVDEIFFIENFNIYMITG